MILRYEKDAQGMKSLHKVIKCVFRYEIGVSLKNSGFSYLYGSILLGYEKNRCFSLMWLQKPSILRACVREEDAGGGRAMGPENAVGEWARRRKGE